MNELHAVEPCVLGGLTIKVENQQVSKCKRRGRLLDR